MRWRVLNVSRGLPSGAGGESTSQCRHVDAAGSVLTQEPSDLIDRRTAGHNVVNQQNTGTDKSTRSHNSVLPLDIRLTFASTQSFLTPPLSNSHNQTGGQSRSHQSADRTSHHLGRMIVLTEPAKPVRRYGHNQVRSSRGKQFAVPRNQQSAELRCQLLAGRSFAAEASSTSETAIDQQPHHAIWIPPLSTTSRATTRDCTVATDWTWPDRRTALIALFIVEARHLQPTTPTDQARSNLDGLSLNLFRPTICCVKAIRAFAFTGQFAARFASEVAAAEQAMRRPEQLLEVAPPT